MKKILSVLKHFFIPHEHNDYQPHVLREASVTVMLALILGVFVAGLGGKALIKYTGMEASVLPAVLVDLTNQNRTTNNQKALTINPVLAKAAQLKANDMAEKGYFAHTSPEGISPWYWFDQAHYLFLYAGENLAIDFSESTDVETAWMNSPGHRANILNAKFTEIGIATKEGIYHGLPTTFVVQLFGTPVRTNPIKGSLPEKIDTKKNPVKNPTKPAPVKITPTTVATTDQGSAPVELAVLSETANFISVKNESAVLDASTSNVPTEDMAYSTWYERLVVSPSRTISYIYIVIACFIMLSSLLYIGVEIRYHHKKQAVYGILLLVIIAIFCYLNAHLFQGAIVI